MLMLALTTLGMAAEESAGEEASDNAPDLPELLSHLAETGNESMRFEETRPSSLLAEPVTVTGTLQRDGDRLIRETSTPRRETQTLTASHVEIRRPGGFRQRFSLSRAPELAALRQALLALLDGNLDQLDQHFKHALAWEEQAWTLELTPRGPDTAERVHKLTLAGQEYRLESMTLELTDGDQIQTRFLRPESEHDSSSE